MFEILKITTSRNSQDRQISRYFFGNAKCSTIFFVTNEIKKNGFKIKKVSHKNNEILFSNEKINILSDFDYPWIVYEIFGQELYNFHADIDRARKYTVFDIGANRGYASLYFVQKDYVTDIYAFELVPQTFELLKKNIDLNPEYKDKIHPYCFGLGKENTDIEIKRLDHRDGCNTINQDFIQNYMPEEIGKGVPVKCEIKRASEVLKQLIVENNIENIILKIDVEGAEYDIFDDLVENYPEIFNKVQKIVGETHLGFDRFFNKIKSFNYEITWKNPLKNGTCPFELSKRELPTSTID